MTHFVHGELPHSGFARAAAFATVVCLPASGLQAADTVLLPTGTRVRATMTTGSSPLVGAVVALDDKTLSLELQDHIAIALRRDDIVGLAVSEGRRSKGHGAWIGAAIGAGAGAVVGIAGGLATGDGGDEKALSAVESGAILAFLGGSLGGLIGLAVPATERWKEVPVGRIRVSVAPARGRGVAASLEIGF